MLDGRTRLREFYQEGAAKIRLPQTFDASMEAVIINTAGGLTGGDRMNWSVAAGPGTRIDVTTQACEKIYKASAGTAEVTTRIEAGAGARVDWLPQETILFDRASGLFPAAPVLLIAGGGFVPAIRRVPYLGWTALALCLTQFAAIALRRGGS